MHTDEYEISCGREVILCRQSIKRLKNAIREREERYKMTTEEFFSALETGLQTEGNPDFLSWREDHVELENWQRMLGEYEAALQVLKDI